VPNTDRRLTSSDPAYVTEDGRYLVVQEHLVRGAGKFWVALDTHLSGVGGWHVVTKARQQKDLLRFLGDKLGADVRIVR
jgi:hypothetical protein